MKYYYVNTRFGPVSFKSYNVTEHTSTPPYHIDYKNLSVKKESLVDVFVQGSSKRHRDKRKYERFMAKVWYMYMNLAMKEMIVNNARIPITDKGCYMAIGVNKLAAFRRDFKFNPKTFGVIYMPVVVNIRALSSRIKYYYRIRLHPNVVRKYGHILTSGKVYETQPSESIIQEVNEFYNNSYVKRLRNTKKHWKNKILPYVVKL